MPAPIDPILVKKESEKIILALGGEVLDTLPWLERTEPRSQSDAVVRALILNATLQIYFGAPTSVIRDWVARNNLTSHLSNAEQELLTKINSDLTEQERTNLFWSIEALWALAWAGSLIDDVPIELPVGNNLAGFMPDLQKNEDGTKLESKFRLRSADDVYGKLDLYFRAHWYARNGNLTGKPTGVFDLDRIMERRKALEWLSDRSIHDWDDTPDCT